jgi:hypothetical protein
VENLLDGRTTRLRFDDYTSDSIQIDNGIGQGDPLSMIAFLFYNADLLDIAEYQNESTLAFVDDSLVAVEGDDFEDTTSDLSFFMNREDGGFDWSKRHNSSFEIDKLAVMHCTNKRLCDPANARKSVPLPRPDLKLQGRVI